MMQKRHIITYMHMLRLWAQLSYCERGKVGSFVVTKSGMIAPGYNGTFPGDPNVCEVEGYEYKMVTSPEVYHAEQNSLAKMLEEGVSAKDATLFVTLSPCLDCAKWVARAGIKHVIYDQEYRCTKGIDFLKRHKVLVEHFGVYEGKGNAN